MPGLSSELYNRCRTTLLKCGEFDRDTSLRAVFITDDLYPFRDRLPSADNKAARVDAVLGYLLEQQISDGRPVLPLFLAALRDKYQPGDALRDELDTLTQAVQGALAPAREPFGAPARSRHKMASLHTQLEEPRAGRPVK